MHVQSRFFDDPVTVAVVVACATDETKPLVKSVCESARKSLFWAPPLYQDLSIAMIRLFKKPLLICQSG